MKLKYNPFHMRYEPAEDDWELKYNPVTGEYQYAPPGAWPMPPFPREIRRGGMGVYAGCARGTSFEMA